MSDASEVETVVGNLRREERRETNWIAKIRLFDGSEIPTSIKDVSPSGALFAVPASTELPERFMFRVIGHDFVFAVRMAWRRGSLVGVQIERVGKLDPKAASPEAPPPQVLPALDLPEEPAEPEPSPHEPIRKRGSRISRF